MYSILPQMDVSLQTGIVILCMRPLVSPKLLFPKSSQLCIVVNQYQVCLYLCRFQNIVYKLHNSDFFEHFVIIFIIVCSRLPHGKGKNHLIIVRNTYVIVNRRKCECDGDTSCQSFYPSIY